MLTIWEEPQRWSGYVLGVDTAEGLGHGDYSCIQVIDCKDGKQVAVWHGRIPPDELSQEVYNLGVWYGNALCCVEANNHGLTTIVGLRQLGYPNLYRRRTLNSANQRTSSEFGWLTTRTSKPLMIDELAQALKNLSPKIAFRNGVFTHANSHGEAAISAPWAFLDPGRSKNVASSAR